MFKFQYRLILGVPEGAVTLYSWFQRFVGLKKWTPRLTPMSASRKKLDLRKDNISTRKE